MSAPGEQEKIANDQVLLDSTYNTHTSTELISNGELYTRVMARDPSSTYTISGATTGTQAVFDSIDTDVFMEKLDEEYPEIIKDCKFVSSITAEGTAYDVEIVMNTDDGSRYVLAAGDILDEDLITTMNSWGVAMTPIPIYGSVTYYVDSTHTGTETVKMTSQAEVNSLANTVSEGHMEWSTTIRGRTIANTDIQGVTLSAQVSSINDDFLAGCTSLINLDISETSITTIPFGFLAFCTSFNQAIDLSDVTTILGEAFYGCTSFNRPLDLSSATTIGTDFLHGCASFNQSITLSNNLTTLPTGFLSMCYSYNQPIDVSHIVTIASDVFYGCSSFNHPLNFAALTTIGSYFMEACISYNKPIVLPSTVQYIGIGFLYDCVSFNETIAAPGATGIGAYFLQGCSAYNKALSFLSNVTEIGHNFLAECVSFNQSLILSSTTEIGDYFLYGCTSFNQPILLSPDTTTIGEYFLYNCNSMVSAVNVGSLEASVIESSDYSFATDLSTASCYTVGIVITGANKTAWANKFPNSSVSPYRRIIGPTYGTVTYYTNAMHTATNTVSIKGDNDYNTLFNQGSSWQANIDNVSINNNDIVSVALTSEVSDIPDYFLNNCSNLSSVDVSSVVIEYIGAMFLAGCTSFNAPLTVNVMYIDYGFLSGCTNFNNTLTLPNALAINGGFLYECTSYNKPLDISSVYWTGDQFMQGCTAFNNTLSLISSSEVYYPVVHIGNGFMLGCTSFNRPINTGFVYHIGDMFMAGCTTFNQSLDLSNCEDIGDGFLTGCTSFNQNLDFSYLESLGAGALWDCQAMVSTVTVGSALATITPEDDYTFGASSSSAPSVNTGIGISGTTASAWMARLPNSEVGPYIIHYKLASASTWTKYSYSTEAAMEAAARDFATNATAPFDIKMGMAESPYRKLVNRTP